MSEWHPLIYLFESVLIYGAHEHANTLILLICKHQNVIGTICAQLRPWISTVGHVTRRPVGLEPQPSAILSSAVSGARIRLLFVSTMCPFWIISSRMMWTRSRLNMIWWRHGQRNKHTLLTSRKQNAAQMGRIRPVRSVGTHTHTHSSQTGHWQENDFVTHSDVMLNSPPG